MNNNTLPMRRHELCHHVPGLVAGRDEGHIRVGERALGQVGGVGQVRLLRHHGHRLMGGQRLVPGQQHVPRQNWQQI
jgi:hypothetical protein